MSVLANLNAKTLELRKGRDELAGRFQAVQALAIASAKERARVAGDPQAYEVVEDDAIKAVQKAIKIARDTLAIAPNDALSQREAETLEALLPQAASEDEIRAEAQAILASMEEVSKGAMGDIMKALNAKFGAALDKSKASQIAREVLAA